MSHEIRKLLLNERLKSSVFLGLILISALVHIRVSQYSQRENSYRILDSINKLVSDRMSVQFESRNPTRGEMLSSLELGGANGAIEAYLVNDRKRVVTSRFLTWEELKDLPPLDNQSVRMALKGHSGHAAVSDYRGVSVRSSYGPVTINGERFAMIVEMSESEFLRAVRLQVSWSCMICVLSLLVLFAMHWAQSDADRAKEHMNELSHAVHVASIDESPFAVGGFDQDRMVEALQKHD